MNMVEIYFFLQFNGDLDYLHKYLLPIMYVRQHIICECIYYTIYNLNMIYVYMRIVNCCYQGCQKPDYCIVILVSNLHPIKLLKDNPWTDNLLISIYLYIPVCRLMNNGIVLQKISSLSIHEISMVMVTRVQGKLIF